MSQSLLLRHGQGVQHAQKEVGLGRNELSLSVCGGQIDRCMQDDGGRLFLSHDPTDIRCCVVQSNERRGRRTNERTIRRSRHSSGGVRHPFRPTHTRTHTTLLTTGVMPMQSSIFLHDMTYRSDPTRRGP